MPKTRYPRKQRARYPDAQAPTRWDALEIAARASLNLQPKRAIPPGFINRLLAVVHHYENAA